MIASTVDATAGGTMPPLPAYVYFVRAVSEMVPHTSTVDAVPMQDGDRVLVKNNTGGASQIVQWAVASRTFAPVVSTLAKRTLVVVDADGSQLRSVHLGTQMASKRSAPRPGGVAKRWMIYSPMQW